MGGVITKRAKPIAKISQAGKRPKALLTSHKELRAAIASKGKPLSVVVAESRGKERS